MSRKDQKSQAQTGESHEKKARPPAKAGKRRQPTSGTHSTAAPKGESPQARLQKLITEIRGAMSTYASLAAGEIGTYYVGHDRPCGAEPVQGYHFDVKLAETRYGDVLAIEGQDGTWVPHEWLFEKPKESDFLTGRKGEIQRWLVNFVRHCAAVQLTTERLARTAAQAEAIKIAAVTVAALPTSSGKNWKKARSAAKPVSTEMVTTEGLWRLDDMVIETYKNGDSFLGRVYSAAATSETGQKCLLQQRAPYVPMNLVNYEHEVRLPDLPLQLLTKIRTALANTQTNEVAAA